MKRFEIFENKSIFPKLFQHVIQRILKFPIHKHEKIDGTNGIIQWLQYKTRKSKYISNQNIYFSKMVFIFVAIFVSNLCDCIIIVEIKKNQLHQ